jgi:RNA polymerase sigma factor (sigma-70 family)
VSRPTVFVVDDDRSVRRSLVRLLRSHDLESEAFETASDYLDQPAVEGPSCLVLDVRLPDRSGLDLQEELQRRGLHPSIVFITGHATVPMSVQAMKRGAVDFLPKPFEEEELIRAVQAGLAEDEKRLRRQSELDRLARRLSSLTPREREVFRLVASGLLNKQVASRLGTSEKTVKVHRGRVMRKMKAGSLADLVRMDQQLDGQTAVASVA